MRREAVGCDMFSIVSAFEVAQRPREAEFEILNFGNQPHGQSTGK